MSLHLQVRSEVVIQAGRVAVVYALIFFASILLQVVAKIKAAKQHVKNKNNKKKDTNTSTNDNDTSNSSSKDDNNDDRFNRYSCTHPTLIAADRCVGNFVEWAPCFIILFIFYVLIVQDESMKYGWLYVVGRSLYPVLAMNGGVRPSGAKPVILVATLPAYVALMAMLGAVATSVWL